MTARSLTNRILLAVSLLSLVAAVTSCANRAQSSSRPIPKGETNPPHSVQSARAKPTATSPIAEPMPPKARIIYSAKIGPGEKYGLFVASWPNPKPRLLKPRITGKYGLGDYISVPRFSPDGEKVLFRANRILPNGKQVETGGHQGTDIWILDIRRNTARSITSDGAFYDNPQWSPDGRYIAAISDDGNPDPIPPVDNPAEWTQDLYIWNVATGKRTLISHNVNQVTWSRDSKYLYYEGSTKTRICRVPRNGGPSVTIHAPAEFLGSQSPDGKHLTFSVSNGVDAYVLIVKTLGTDKWRAFLSQKLPVQQSLHRWAPDSRRIAVMDIRGESDPIKARLLVLDTSTGQTRVLGSTLNVVAIKGWSRDGKWIVINRYTNDRDMDYGVLDIISAATGRAVTLSKPTRTTGYDWRELPSK